MADSLGITCKCAECRKEFSVFHEDDGSEVIEKENGRSSLVIYERPDGYAVPESGYLAMIRCPYCLHIHNLR